MGLRLQGSSALRPKKWGSITPTLRPRAPQFRLLSGKLQCQFSSKWNQGIDAIQNSALDPLLSFVLLSFFTSVNKKWRQINDHIAITSLFFLLFAHLRQPVVCACHCTVSVFQFSGSFLNLVFQIFSILKSCYVDRRTGQAWWALVGLLDERAMYEF